MVKARKIIQYTVLVAVIVIFPLMSLYGAALNVYEPGTPGILQYRDSLYQLGIIENSHSWSFITTLDNLLGMTTMSTDYIIKISEQLKGVPWTITIFGLTISDPLAVLSVFLGDKSVNLAFLSGAIIPIVLAFLFGRVFCGWLCPMHTLLELNLKVRNFLKKKHVPIRNLGFSRRWKFVFLLIGFVLSASGIQIFSYILPYLQLGRNAFYWFFYGTFSVGVIFIILIVFLELFVSERGWCRYFCPSGAFLQIFSRYKILNLKHDVNKCLSGCSKCSKVCELNLNTKIFNTECNNCGKCIAACPKGALSLQMKFYGQKEDLVNNDVISG